MTVTFYFFTCTEFVNKIDRVKSVKPDLYHNKYGRLAERSEYLQLVMQQIPTKA